MITRTDMTKQKISLMVSAIKFTEAGWKSYLFSGGIKKGNWLVTGQNSVTGYLHFNLRRIKKNKGWQTWQATVIASGNSVQSDKPEVTFIFRELQENNATGP